MIHTKRLYSPIYLLSHRIVPAKEKEVIRKKYIYKVIYNKNILYIYTDVWVHVKFRINHPIRDGR